MVPITQQILFTFQVPQGGVRRFQTNRYVVEMIREKQSATQADTRNTQPPAESAGNVCEKHKMPLTVFCNEEDCQQLVCHTCLLVKHKDHNIMEIPEKVQELTEEMKSFKIQMDSGREEYAKEIKKLKDAEDEVSKTAKNALDKIAKRREKMLEVLEEAAEEETLKVFEIEHKELQHIRKSYKILEERKRRMKNCIKFLTEVIQGNNPQEIGAKYTEIKQKYNETLADMEATKNMTHFYKTIQFHDDKAAVFLKSGFGNVYHIEHKVGYSHRRELEHGACASSREPGTSQHAAASCSQGSSVRNRVDMPLCAMLKNTWRTEGDRISCSRTGSIYTTSYFTGKLEAFNMHGSLKMANKLSTGLKGLSCISYNGRYMLVLARNYALEMRCTSSGGLLGILSNPGFHLYNGICQDSPGTVLVSGMEEGQEKLVQYIIGNGQITRGNKEIPVTLGNCLGLTIITTHDQKIVVFTSLSEKSIKAVDFETGREIWEITRATFNGKDVEPYDVCTDGASHLFVSDSHAGRVLVVNIHGQIEREICTDLCEGGKFLSAVDYVSLGEWNALVVLSGDEEDEESDKRYQVNMYEIKSN